MRLTVLGNASRYLAPLEGGSSYLVEHEGRRILLDAGQGAREALARAGVDRLDAVWISHFHFDHCLDLPVLSAVIHDRTPILVPRGERARLDALARAYAWDPPRWSLGEVREVDEGEALDVAGLRWSFARTQHSAPSLGVRLATPEGASLVYASDGAPCPPLAALAGGCDLLLAHALLADVDPEAEHARIHATGRTAGELARAAGAKRLLISHRYHGIPDEEMLAEARRAFPGAELARTGEATLIRRGGGRPS